MCQWITAWPLGTDLQHLEGHHYSVIKQGAGQIFLKAPRDAKMIYSSANRRTGRWVGLRRQWVFVWTFVK